MQKAIDEFEKVLLQNKTGYLVGDCLTLADITVASIFAPLLSMCLYTMGKHPNAH
jgi:glutathione S-transferase